MLRVVADANVYVAAVISRNGPAARIIDAARAGRITLLMSDTLVDEVSDVLARDKFRRWLTEEEASDFVDAVTILAEWVDDRPADEIPLICDDPDDNYLIALAQDSESGLLVSGDKAVQRVKYPNVMIYSPAAALELLEFQHEWGDGFIPGDPAAISLQLDAEGSWPLINVFAAFSEVFQFADGAEHAAEMLPWVTVPSAVEPFVEQFDQVRDLLAGRGLGTRPLYASPEVAYLKLPPNPKVAIVSTGPFMLPEGTIFATLQRCPDLPDREDLPFDHWRVFGVGSQWPVEQIALRPS